MLPTCPSCGAAVLPEDRYCEACGTQLFAERSTRSTTRGESSCGRCGAPPSAIDPDGRCTRCGATNHRTVDVGYAAGITHRGHVHTRNEDALFLDTVGAAGVVAVVCDGVSVSVKPDIAAGEAAHAAGALLVQAVRERPDALDAATVDALAAAQEAAAAVRWRRRPGLAAPSCTFVSAVWHRDAGGAGRGQLTVGWAGDSRAYWIGDEVRQLTVDNSWAQEQIADHLLSAEDAEADPRAHSITRWLGQDAPPDPAQVVTFRPGGAGRVVVCSDGLWNYAPTLPELASWVREPGDDATPLAVARALTTAALEAGGRDNITVAVIDVAPAGREPAGRDPAGRDPAGRDPAGRDTAGREPGGGAK